MDTCEMSNDGDLDVMPETKDCKDRTGYMVGIFGEVESRKGRLHKCHMRVMAYVCKFL
jgi:hypothetical protein